MADWLRSTAVGGVASAFSTLRELPPKPTERTGKLSNDLELAAKREPRRRGGGGAARAPCRHFAARAPPALHARLNPPQATTRAPLTPTPTPRA